MDKELVREDGYNFELEGAPFDDEMLTYDKEDHRYRLNLAYVDKRLGIDLNIILGGKAKAVNFLLDISDQVYDWLYANIHRTSAVIIEYKIAKKDQYGEYSSRKGMGRAMIEAIRYSLDSDGDKIGSNSGIDLVHGTVIDMDKLRGKIEISATTTNILRSYQLSFRGEYRQTIHPDIFRSDY